MDTNKKIETKSYHHNAMELIFSTIHTNSEQYPTCEKKDVINSKGNKSNIRSFKIK